MFFVLIASVFRPTISGALSEVIGWRGIVWLCVGVAGVFEILFVTCFRETYHPTILKRRAAQKRKETGDDSFVAEVELEDDSKGATLRQSMIRPVQIAWSSTLLQCLSLWGGVMFAFFYVNSTSLPEILEVKYNFSPSKRGLSYLAWSKLLNCCHLPRKLTISRCWICHRYQYLQLGHGQNLQEAQQTAWRILS